MVMDECNDGNQQQYEYSTGNVNQNPYTTGGLIECQHTCLELSVLSCAILQVEIHIPIIVTVKFIIHGRVGERHLLCYGSLQFRHIINSRNGKCHIQAFNRFLGFTNTKIATA